MTCPGSVALTKDLKDEGSKFAEEGTAAHFLASEVLERPGLEVQTFAGQKIVVEGNGRTRWLDDSETIS